MKTSFNWLFKRFLSYKCCGIKMKESKTGMVQPHYYIGEHYQCGKCGKVRKI